MQGKSNQNSWWLCKCDCGKDKLIRRNILHTSNPTCGCLGKYQPSPGFGQLYGTYKFSAKRKNQTFNIPQDLFFSLVTSPCSYCGLPPSGYINTTYRSKTNIPFHYNGIDRVDNSRGYEPDNIVPACKPCNLAKRDMSKADFLAWINFVYTHQHPIST